MIRRLFSVTVASFLAISCAVAQDDDPPASPQPNFPGRRAPGFPNQNAPLSSGQDMVKLQFPNSDVIDVLHFYEGLTGTKLVIDNNVQGKVNIFVSQEVPRKEAIEIIEMNLALNGFSLVQTEGDVVEVVGVNKNPRAAAVPIISNPEDIPDGAKVVSYLFHLNYADPQELQGVLSQYLSGIGGQAPILALPKSSSLLVTQSADVLRKLVKIVQQLDVAPAPVESDFIKLDRADASKVVDMLKDIFEKGNDTSSSIGGVRRLRGVPVPNQNDDEGGSAVLSEDSLIVGKIKLEADVRTNRIHVVTRPINMPFVRKLIGEFDENIEFGTPVTRPLQYIAAADVLPVLVQALTEPGAENQQGQGLGAPRNNNNNPSRNPTPSSSPTNSTSSSGGDTSLQVSEELETQPVDTTPQAVTVGNTKLIADARANSIIVLGTRDVVVKVEKILDQMDVRAPQVALSTVIGELSLNNSEEFGVDWFYQFKKNNLGNAKGFGGGLNNGLGSLSSASPIIDPASLITYPVFASLPTGSGATAYVAAGNTLSAIVTALDSTGRFHTISRPTVFTSNNKKAIIASGEEIPVPVSTISAATGASTILSGGLSQESNIEYKKIALQLEVVPLINANKEVSLDILQQLDSEDGSQALDGNNIPIIATRYIRTTVLAPNGSTIVLGGLIQTSVKHNKIGLPILDRIPVIGNFFSDTTTSKTRSELIVLMRPEVTLTKLDLYQERQKLENKSHFGSEIDEEDQPLPTEGKQLPAPDLPPSK
ncbi:MAG TPA: secretin N-terminal domain-containing protein [Chthoniobacterales bacterium]